MILYLLFVVIVRYVWGMGSCENMIRSEGSHELVALPLALEQHFSLRSFVYAQPTALPSQELSLVALAVLVYHDTIAELVILEAALE